MEKGGQEGAGRPEDVEKELARLEEVFRSGFVGEDEYNSRRAALLGRSSTSEKHKPQGEEHGASCNHDGHDHANGCCHHNHAENGEEDDDDPDYNGEDDMEEEEVYFECDSCQKEIEGARFHCLDCEEVDQCADCFNNRKAITSEDHATKNHKADHLIQAIEAADQVEDDPEEFLSFADKSEKVYDYQVKSGTRMFEAVQSSARMYFMCNDAEAVELAQALASTVTVTTRSSEETRQEMSRRVTQHA